MRSSLSRLLTLVERIRPETRQEETVIGIHQSERRSPSYVFGGSRCFGYGGTSLLVSTPAWRHVAEVLATSEVPARSNLITASEVAPKTPPSLAPEPGAEFDPSRSISRTQGVTR